MSLGRQTIKNKLCDVSHYRQGVLNLLNGGVKRTGVAESNSKRVQRQNMRNQISKRRFMPRTRMGQGTQIMDPFRSLIPIHQIGLEELLNSLLAVKCSPVRDGR